MIVGSGHNKTLDWWALGILIYEMIIGIPPFYNPNKNQMYYLIQNSPIRWPEKAKHGIEVSPKAKDLISKVSLVNVSLNSHFVSVDVVKGQDLALRCQR